VAASHRSGRAGGYAPNVPERQLAAAALLHQTNHQLATPVVAACASRRQRHRVRTSGCSYRRSTYRSWSSSRERGGVQRRSSPRRRRASALLRARSNALRSLTSNSNRSVSRALTESPSSAAMTRASRRRSASSFRVTFVFIRSLVAYDVTCWRSLRQPRLTYHHVSTPIVARVIG